MASQCQRPPGHGLSPPGVNAVKGGSSTRAVGPAEQGLGGGGRMEAAFGLDD